MRDIERETGKGWKEKKEKGDMKNNRIRKRRLRKKQDERKTVIGRK